MKKYFLFSLVFLLYQMRASAQTKTTQVFSDTAEVSIISVVPDSFPDLSLLFRTRTKQGFPVWGLSKEQLKIYENGQSCEIVKLDQITEDLPIQMVIILDHSGSMISDNYSQLTALEFYLNYEKLKLKSPLANAKKAILHFLDHFDNPNDLVSIIGFSNYVDVITNFSNDKSLLSKQMKRLEEDGQTAFFDAISTGLDSLSGKEGVRVIVALTDGEDNCSQTTSENIVNKAKELEIPVYIIGLGEINKKQLEAIAGGTNGAFYYTKKSTSLTDVYDNVAKQIKSIYELKYTSNVLNHTISDHDVVLEFETDTMAVVAGNINYNIPEAYVQKKTAEEELVKRHNRMLGISIFAFSAGAVVYLSFRKRKKTIA